jgi:hypothetical protein
MATGSFFPPHSGTPHDLIVFKKQTALVKVTQ